MIEGDAVDSDFWDKLVISESVKLVLLAMPGHAGNVYALQRLSRRAFADDAISALKPAPSGVT